MENEKSNESATSLLSGKKQKMVSDDETSSKLKQGTGPDPGIDTPCSQPLLLTDADAPTELWEHINDDEEEAEEEDEEEAEDEESEGSDMNDISASEALMPPLLEEEAQREGKKKEIKELSPTENDTVEESV